MTSEINKSVFNTSFAEKDVVYSDGQINVMPLPEAIMANGFIPETRDAPGMPLAAQHLNWLFRDLYRRANQLDQLLPAWAPIPCPMTQPPAGFLKCNGAVFDKEKYPELAKGYPSGVLPDLRGEFIRGWDDGRGIDVGRSIISLQDDTMQRIMGGVDGFFDFISASGAFTVGNPSSRSHAINNTSPGNHSFHFDSSMSTRTSNETRPRNIAFLYIVRAA